jgi:hypothetical protein
MKRSQKMIIFLSMAIVLAAMVLAALLLLPRTGRQADSKASALMQVDGRFLMLYQSLGGEAVLGKIISPLVTEGDQLCQYAMNAKLCVLVGRLDLDAYSLAPVVMQGGLMPVVNMPVAEQQSGKLVNGFVIHADFIGLYEKLYGTRFAGEPLGNAWVNYDKGRIEQYFENVVIAQDLNDAQSQPYLLPVAHAVCSHYCDFPIETRLFIPQAQQRTSPFSTFLAAVDGYDFGAPLTRPFLNQDGQLVQVFEYAAVAAPPDALDEAKLLPLSAGLRMHTSPPTQQIYGVDRGVYYYPVGDSGYHVPIVFDEFIVGHGGRSVAGNPIAEVMYYEDDAIRQCFENYCLDLHQDEANGSVEAVLAPLGIMYLKQGLADGSIDREIVVDEWHQAHEIQVAVEKQSNMVDQETQQQIFVTVLSTQDGEPISGIQSFVRILSPDNQEQVLELINTNTQGVSWVSIPAHSGADNGTLMRYEVCVVLLSGEQVCISGAYLVQE